MSDWSKNFEVVFQDEEGKVVLHSCGKLHLKLLHMRGKDVQSLYFVRFSSI